MNAFGLLAEQAGEQAKDVADAAADAAEVEGEQQIASSEQRAASSKQQAEQWCRGTWGPSSPLPILPQPSQTFSPESVEFYATMKEKRSAVFDKVAYLYGSHRLAAAPASTLSARPLHISAHPETSAGCDDDTTVRETGVRASNGLVRGPILLL